MPNDFDELINSSKTFDNKGTPPSKNSDFDELMNYSQKKNQSGNGSNNPAPTSTPVAAPTSQPSVNGGQPVQSGNTQDFFSGIQQGMEAIKPTTPTQPVLTTPSVQKPSGLVEGGNIDLSQQPSVPNKETGGNSTVWSMSIGTDKGETLISRVTPDGKILSKQEAVDYYKQTGKNLGTFKSVDDADNYAEQLHQDYANGLITPKQLPQPKSNSAVAKPQVNPPSELEQQAAKGQVIPEPITPQVNNPKNLNVPVTLNVSQKPLAYSTETQMKQNIAAIAPDMPSSGTGEMVQANIDRRGIQPNILATPTDLQASKDIQDANAALQQNPNDLNAMFKAGYAYQSTGNIPTAKAAYNNILQIDPTNADANQNLGYLSYLDKDYDKSLSYYQTALKAKPTDSNLALGVAQNLWQKAKVTPEGSTENLAQAKNIIDQITSNDDQNNPTNTQAWQIKGLIEHDLGKKEDSDKAFQQANMARTINTPIAPLEQKVDPNTINPNSIRHQLFDAFVTPAAGAVNDVMDLKFAENGLVGITDGLSDIHQGTKDYFALDLNPKKTIGGLVQTLNGGAKVLFGGLSFTPEGFEFTQGINVADKYTNGQAGKLLMQPLSYLYTPDSKIGQNTQDLLNTVVTLGAFAGFHKLVGGDAAGYQKTTDAIKDFQDGKDLSGDQVKTLVQDIHQNATPENFGAIKSAIDLLPKNTKSENVIPNAKLIVINETANDHINSLTDQVNEILKKDVIGSVDLLKISDLEKQIDGVNNAIDDQLNTSSPEINKQIADLQKEKDGLYKSTNGLDLQKDAENEKQLTEQILDLQNQRQQVRSNLLNQKIKSDAPKIESAAKVDVRQQAENGEAVGEGNVVNQKPTQQGEGKEEVRKPVNQLITHPETEDSENGLVNTNDDVNPDRLNDTETAKGDKEAKNTDLTGFPKIETSENERTIRAANLAKKDEGVVPTTNPLLNTIDVPKKLEGTPSDNVDYRQLIESDKGKEFQQKQEKLFDYKKEHPDTAFYTHSSVEAAQTALDATGGKWTDETTDKFVAEKEKQSGEPQEKAKPTPEESRQFAIDMVNSGLVEKGADVRQAGDKSGARVQANTNERLDLEMSSADRNKAIADIKEGNYETAPAKKLIEKLSDFHQKDEFPYMRGTGGTTDRFMAMNREQMGKYMEKDASDLIDRKEAEITKFLYDNKYLNDNGDIDFKKLSSDLEDNDKSQHWGGLLELNKEKNNHLKQLTNEAAKNESTSETKVNNDGNESKDNGKVKAADEKDGEQKELKGDGKAASIPTKGEEAKPVNSAEPPKTKLSTEEKIRTPLEDDDKEWSAIRKEKLKEIEGAKELFEKQNPKSWNSTMQDAMQHLQERYPDKSLHEAAQAHIAELAGKFDKGELHNPTSEDLATMGYLRAVTDSKLRDLEADRDLDSPILRAAAQAQYEALKTDLLNIAKAANPSEAGRAFNLRQLEAKIINPDNGLAIRRMELSKAKGGEPLTAEEKEWTADHWAKEKELLEREHELKEKNMQEKFDKQIADLHKEYQDKNNQVKSQREKTLSQKGKDIADKIRKLKTAKGQLNVDFSFGTWNLAVEGVAKLVEGGATVAEAIKKLVDEGTIAFKKSTDQRAFEDELVGGIDRQDKRETALDQIKANAEATTITKEMVAKNHIRDYVNSFIGEVEPKDLLDEAYKGLKKELPDLTKQQLIEGYIKQGDYKIDTEAKIKSDYNTTREKLVKLAKIEKDLGDLRDKKDLFKDNPNPTKEKLTDRNIAAKEEELKQAMRDNGIKVANEDKYSKASYNERAATHNQRIDDLRNKVDDIRFDKDLTDKQKSDLQNLSKQLNDSKITLDPKSVLSQKKVIDNGIKAFKEIKTDFDKSAKGDFADIKSDMQKIVDRFDSDKDKSEQDVKLQQTKDKLKSDRDEFQRKLNANEFDDNQKITLTKSDAELAKLQVAKNKIESEFRKKQEYYRNSQKPTWQRVAETAKNGFIASLIYNPIVAVKIASSTFLKPALETFTKHTFGRIGKSLFPSISERAMAGGEGINTKEAWEAYFKNKGADSFAKEFKASRDKYDQANKAYEDALKNPNSSSKQINQLKIAKDKALFNTLGKTIYEFLGSSTLKDIGKTFIDGVANAEEVLGKHAAKSIKDGDAIDKLNYLISTIGRGHSALKTPSGRFHFAAGFMARLEYGMKHGEDFASPEKLQQYANESLMDWDRGKYQQSNFTSDTWNHITNRVESSSQGTKYENLGRAASIGLRADVPITRVPVNILHESVFEYMSGAFRAAIDANSAYKDARKALADAGITKENSEDFQKALKEQIQTLDKDKAATILRCFRKGGFGLGMFALVALGGISYGGFHHEGEKNEDKKKNSDELKAGEIMLGDKKMGIVADKIMEHTAAFAPALYAANYLNMYGDKIKRGETTPDAATDAINSDLQHMIESVPPLKAFGAEKAPNYAKKTIIKDANGIADWKFKDEDIDKNGKLIDRKPLDVRDWYNMATNNRDKVPAEQQAKEIKTVTANFNKAIDSVNKSTKLSKTDRESKIKELEEKREKAINRIRK